MYGCMSMRELYKRLMCQYLVVFFSSNERKINVKEIKSSKKRDVTLIRCFVIVCSRELNVEFD